MNITLTDITLELMHEYDREFQYDPDIFMDMSRFPEWKYDVAVTEARFQRYQLAADRKYFFIMAGGKPVGEICLKHIDRAKKQAELSIHLQNDTVKNRGIGTAAEKLLLAYAFDEMGLDTVLADSVLKNTRSQHVLEKVGFDLIAQKDGFKYYRFTRQKYESQRHEQ